MRRLAVGASLFILAMLMAGCTPNPRETNSPPGPLRVPMSQAGGSALRNSGLGNAYDGQPTPMASCVRWQGQGIYAGCARRVAKVSLVPETEAPTEVYASVADFKAQVLDAPTLLDSFMRGGIQPPLRDSPTHERHPSERRNVAIDVLLLAVKHEPDNDYHLIVGDPGCQQPGCFFNVEISGLPMPEHPDFDALLKAQDDFEVFIDHTPVDGSYHYWEDPPRARVSGSLFYDISHGPGQVGPQGMRPWTAWEIHPVRSIEIWEE